MAHQTAPQAANSKAGWLLRGEENELNRPAWSETCTLQCSNRFKAAQHADSSVVGAGIGNGVDMRAGGDRRQIHFRPLPAGERIANRILGDRKRSFRAKAFDIGTRAQIGLVEHNAGHHWRLLFGDKRQRSELAAEPVDLKHGNNAGLRSHNASSSSQWVPAPVFVNQIFCRLLADCTEPLRAVGRHPDKVACLHRIPSIPEAINATAFKHE